MADAELQRPAAAALANLCSDASLAQQLVASGGMPALIQLADSPDREVQARPKSTRPIMRPCRHRTCKYRAHRDTMPTIDCVLFGSGKSQQGVGFWQPSDAACLHSHLASWQEILCSNVDEIMQRQPIF